MVHEALFFTDLPRVDNLFHARGSQSHSCERLRFSASEKGAAVSTRQNSDLAGNRTDFVKSSSVPALVFFKNCFIKKLLPLGINSDKGQFLLLVRILRIF